MTELKTKAAKGFLWSGIERILTQGVTFVLGLIVARLLTPDDYGLVAMITVFIAVTNIFVDCGFSSALIRLPERTKVDESTAFFTNIAVGIVAYIILYLCAPLIASFYEEKTLVSIIRTVGITLIFNSFAIIQQTVLMCKIDFKTQAKISLFFNLISGLIGVILAYTGFGVWALVAQTVSSSLFRTLFLWLWVQWRPGYTFSVISFKKLFSFGSRLLISGLLDTGYRNIYLLLIGKYYSAVSLGYYTRAIQFANFPSSNLSDIIQRVSYPVLSLVQADDEQLKSGYRKILELSAFITFPLMIWLAVAAQPLITILLTDKWIDAVSYLQIICFAMMWYPIHSINLNLLQVKGRSDLFLRLEIIKKLLSVTVLLITLPMGLLSMCWGQVITSLIALIINTYYTGKLIHVGFMIQIFYFLPVLLRSFIAGGISLATVMSFDNNYIRVLLSFVLGGVGYVLISLPMCRSLGKEVIKAFKGYDRI